MGFIRKTWLNSYRDSDFARHIPQHIYEQIHGAAIGRILARGRVRVVCEASSPGLVLGFAVTEASDRLLHYVWVKPRWRQKGLCRQLIGPLKVQHYTHRHRGTRWIRQVLPATTHNPYLL